VKRRRAVVPAVVWLGVTVVWAWATVAFLVSAADGRDIAASWTLAVVAGICLALCSGSARAAWRRGRALWEEEE